MRLSPAQIGYIAGMLVTGSINTVAIKTMSQMNSVGINDEDAPFNHPWFQTALMFLGETTVLLMFVALIVSEKRKAEADRKLAETGGEDESSRRMSQRASSIIESLGATTVESLTHEGAPEKTEPEAPLPRPSWFQPVLVIPACFDLVGSSLGNISLLYIDASVWQIFRGSTIVFTGIFGRIFLKKHLKGYNILGISVAVLGLIVVGISAVLNPDATGSTNVPLGIILCLAGQVLAAGQFTIESLFVGPKRIPPVQVVGTEGLVGFTLSVTVLLPVLYFLPGGRVGGRQENALDAVVQISNSGALITLALVFMASIAFYNSFGLLVTKTMTAVHRTLIDACRTAFVWAIQVFLYYCVAERFGENIDAYSILQLDGFLILFTGTAIYNEVLKLDFTPWLAEKMEYPPDTVDGDTDKLIPTNVAE
jgi:drug/metabolite transporter (DMT)-like permease